MTALGSMGINGVHGAFGGIDYEAGGKPMRINDNYEISVDERNIVLKKYIAPVEKTKKLAKDSPRIGTGEFTAGQWSIVGYYRTHQDAIRAYANIELRECPQDVVELLRKIEELHSVIGGLEVSPVYVQCGCKKVSND